MKPKISYVMFTFPFILSGCVGQMEKQEYLQLADATWNAVYEHYSVSGTPLLRETYPFDEGHKATYLDNEEQMNRKNPYSYLWPYSGSLSAVTALYEASGDERYLDLLEEKVLPGLREYYDTRREPAAYASYINSAPLSDRFYDDNVWLGLDFTDLNETLKGMLNNALTTLTSAVPQVLEVTGSLISAVITFVMSVVFSVWKEPWN